MRKLVVLLLLFLGYSCFIAQKEVDSLWGIWEDVQVEDTIRIDALIGVIEGELLKTDPESVFILSNKGLELLDRKKEVKRVERLMRFKGVSLGVRGLNKEAIDLFKENKTYCEEFGYDLGIVYNMSNIAQIYSDLGYFSKSLDLYLAAIELYKKMDNADGLSICYNSIGILYDCMGNSDQSINYYQKALEIAIDNNNKERMLNAYNNIGIVYGHQNIFQEAVKYFLEAYYYALELNDKESIAMFYQNLGVIYMAIGDSAANRILVKVGAMEMLNNSEIKKRGNTSVDGYTANELLDASLMINQELGLRSDVGGCYVLKGRAAKNSQEAMLYYSKAYQIAEETGDYLLKKEVSKYLMEEKKKVGEYKEALELFEKYIVLKDSLTQEETQKKFIRKEYQLNYEKQAAEDSIRHIEAQKVKEIEIEKQKVELKNQKNRQLLLYGGLGIALLFSIYFVRKNKEVREQKTEVEKQKEFAEQQQQIAESQKAILGKQHREITDSINYAQNLQQSVLPSKMEVTQNFPESFVLLKPKDVVSGDFYWTYKKGDLVYLAVVDCTGHGVPGAFMTIVANNLLNEIIQGAYNTPKEIVEELHQRIKLRVGGSPTAQVRDSMDLGLFSLNEKTREVRFVGTHTSVCLVRNSKLTKYKGSKADIGYKPNIAIEEQVFQVAINDMLYMHSDGYPDQKGGPKGKKFYYQPIRKKFEEISLLNIMEQEQIMSQTFEDWKGALDQFDDVCMVGVRIK